MAAEDSELDKYDYADLPTLRGVPDETQFRDLRRAGVTPELMRPVSAEDKAFYGRYVEWLKTNPKTET